MKPTTNLNHKINYKFEPRNQLQVWGEMGVTFIFIKVLALLCLKKMYGFVKLEDPITDSPHQNIPPLANRPLLRARPSRRHYVQRRLAHRHATYTQENSLGETRAAVIEGKVSTRWRRGAHENMVQFYTTRRSGGIASNSKTNKTQNEKFKS